MEFQGEENCEREQLQEEKKQGKKKGKSTGRSCWPGMRDRASNHPCLVSPGKCHRKYGDLWLWIYGFMDFVVWKLKGQRQHICFSKL